MWAMIGGTGFERFEEFQTLENLDGNTPFGAASSGFKRVRLGEETVLFVPRHGQHHELLPSEINYRANIFALKQAGATKILSVSAVGSLRAELKPGDMVVPTQYIDRTKSLRQHTFCGDGVVGHVSLAHPVAPELVQRVEDWFKEFKPGFECHLRKTYVCMEGPAFSTRQESLLYRSWGADIIGMTNYPEYALAREAGLGYLSCCFVTDFDAWNEAIEHVTVEGVMAVMKANNGKAFTFAKGFIPSSQDLLPKGCREAGLKNGLLTSWDAIDEEKKVWLQLLIS